MSGQLMRNDAMLNPKTLLRTSRTAPAGGRSALPPAPSLRKYEQARLLATPVEQQLAKGAKVTPCCTLGANVVTACEIPALPSKVSPLL
eukprot:366553-Chlamydomonas_euryale.AAC.10